MTVITVFLSSGYCRTGSSNAARSPISRISRLTTAASTGPADEDVGEPHRRLLHRGVWAGGGRRVRSDDHRRAVLQLELARADDDVAGRHAADDRDPAIERWPVSTKVCTALCSGLPSASLPSSATMNTESP